MTILRLYHDHGQTALKLIVTNTLQFQHPTTRHVVHEGGGLLLAGASCSQLMILCKLHIIGWLSGDMLADRPG